jgi:hypothetical protein
MTIKFCRWQCADGSLHGMRKWRDRGRHVDGGERVVAGELAAGVLRGPLPTVVPRGAAPSAVVVAADVGLRGQPRRRRGLNVAPPHDDDGHHVGRHSVLWRRRDSSAAPPPAPAAPGGALRPARRLRPLPESRIRRRHDSAGDARRHIRHVVLVSADPATPREPPRAPVAAASGDDGVPGVQRGDGAEGAAAASAGRAGAAHDQDGHLDLEEDASRA